MTDPSQLTDAQLLAIIGGQPQQAAPRQPRPVQAGVSRGERNANQGNIKDGPFARRQPGYAGSDGTFARFSTPEAGNAAQVALLANNYIGAGFDTPTAIVNRYAPPGPENSPESVANYTNYVASSLGIGPNDRVSPQQAEALAQAMREFETGNTRAVGAGGRPAAPDLTQIGDEELLALANGVDPLALHQPDLIDVNALINTQNDFGAPVSQYTQEAPFVALDEATMTPEQIAAYRRSAAGIRKGDYIRLPDGSVQRASSDAYAEENPDRAGSVSQGGGLYTRAPNLGDRIAAFGTGAGEQIPGLDEAATAAVAGLEGRSFSDVRDDYRQMVDLQNQSYRGERIAGGLTGFAGSLAVPVRGAGAFVNAGRGALQQGGRAALLGAGAGAIQGAAQVEGGLGERAQAGAVGGVLGAGMAPIAHGGSNLIGAVAPRIGSGFSEAGSRVAGLFGREAPEAVITREATEDASEYVRRLIGERDITQSPAFLRGKPITAAEAIGPAGISQATALSRRSGRAGEIAQDVLSARADEQSARLIDDVATAAGIDPSVAAGNVADLAQRGRARAAPLYEAAYAQQDVLSPVLEDLLTRPSMQRALRNAQDIILEEGGDPGTMGLIIRPDGTFEPLVRPSMQTWDYIKRGLDDVIEADRDPVTRRLNLDTRGRAADQTRTALRNELTNTEQPWGAAYRAALDAGGDAPRLMTAFQDGARLFSSTTREQDFMSRVGRMGEDERTAAVAGIVDDLYTKARNNRLNLRQLRTPASRAKLTALMGREEADSLIARVTDEQDMARAGGRMMPGTNSVTSEVAEAIRDQDRGAGLMGMLSRNIESSGPVGGTVRTGMEAISSPVAGFVRGVQAPAPQAVRDEIQRLLMMSPAEIQELISALPTATRQNRIGGLLASPVGQSSGVLASNLQ